MSGEQQLALAAGLTAKTKQLCNVTESQIPYEVLESGVADIFDLVTPTTVELLH